MESAKEIDELHNFTRAILSVIDSSKLQDSIVDSLIKGKSMKEIMFGKIGNFELKVANLEQQIADRETAVISMSAKVKNTCELNTKLQKEIGDLNRLIEKFEENQKKSVLENKKFHDNLQKQNSDFQTEIAKLKNEIVDFHKKFQQAEKEITFAHTKMNEKDSEILNVKKNYVNVEKYRKVLEEREKAQEKSSILENNLLAQTTHNQKLKDKLNIVKQEFQSTLSDNDERHKKELTDAHNTTTRWFGASDLLLADKIPARMGNSYRAKSYTQMVQKNGKRNSFKGVDAENLRISWDQMELGESLAVEEQKKDKIDQAVVKFEEIKEQFEVFKNENKKELNASNLKIRALLEENNKLKSENRQINNERNTLKKSANEATSRDNSYIKKSSNTIVAPEFVEKVSKIEKQLILMKKENRSLKSKIEDDAVYGYWKTDLLYTTMMHFLKEKL